MAQKSGMKNKKSDFQQLWKKWTYFVSEPVDEVGQLLESLYSSKDRFYHNQNHIIDCLHKLETVFQTSDPVSATALLFHDAIYNSRDDQNEYNSAQLFGLVRHKFFDSSVYTSQVYNLILLTQHKRNYNPKDLLRREKIVLDIDLSILASPDYESYEQQIRQEYAWVPEEIFWDRRKDFLEGLLKSETIFHSQEGIELYEEKARNNMTQSIENILLNNSHRGPYR